MERLEPEFEDEKIRRWRLPEGSDPPERDPTVLDLDLATEEIFESRVYDVEPLALVALAMGVAQEHPGVSPAEMAAALAGGLGEASLRILAKHLKGDERLTFILVGRFGDTRTLLAREDGVPEATFRAFVSDFETRAFATGLVSPPTIVTLDEWSAYDPGTGRPPSL